MKQAKHQFRRQIKSSSTIPKRVPKGSHTPSKLIKEHYQFYSAHASMSLYESAVSKWGIYNNFNVYKDYDVVAVEYSSIYIFLYKKNSSPTFSEKENKSLKLILCIRILFCPLPLKKSFTESFMLNFNVQYEWIMVHFVIFHIFTL